VKSDDLIIGGIIATPLTCILAVLLDILTPYHNIAENMIPLTFTAMAVCIAYGITTSPVVRRS
jgi:hypothetical protein